MRMKNATAAQKTLPRQSRAPLMTKLGLALIFALGIVIIVMGVQGQRAYDTSGFSAESAYGAIYDLSKDVNAAWENQLRPQLAGLPDGQRAQTDAAVRALVDAAWESAAPGSVQDVEALLAAAPENDRTALTYKLLSAAYLVNGPKVSTAQKKEIAALSDADLAAFQQAVLNGVTDESAALPAAAAKAAGLQGQERQAMLMQLLLTSFDTSDSGDAVNTLKKGVRDKAKQLDAFRMIANGEVSWLWQLIVSNSRTAVLVGIVIALDALLLTLLMLWDKSWIIDVKWIFILLIVDFLLLFQLMPLVYMVIKAFFPEGQFSLETFERLYTYPLNLDALANTLIAAFATMILGTLLAFPLAWLVGRTNLYGRKFFRALFVLTYMVPPYVGAMAWLRLLNPNVGTINQWLRVLFGLSDAPGPLNVYTLPGMVWVLTSFYYPYAFITISRAMEKMDPSLEEASRISGGSPLKTLFTITLPMMMPSLIAGALLVFVSAMSCYGIPSIIGSPGRVHTVTTRIVEYVSLGQQALNDATGMAVFLMVMALIILFISDVVLAKKQYITVSGKSVRPAIVDLRSWRVPLTVIVGIFAVVMIFIPFITIFTTSFKVDIGKGIPIIAYLILFKELAIKLIPFLWINLKSFGIYIWELIFLHHSDGFQLKFIELNVAAENFTLSNWSTVFSRTETMNCLKNSLIYASVTATIGIAIACTMSYLLQRTRVKGRKIPDFLITLGSGTPSVVIALGLIMTMKGNFGINIYNTAYIIIIAYLIKYMMMGMRTVVSAMSQIHVSLEECSQIAGASWMRTMFKITGPLIFPSIAAGWFLIFIPSFYELSMTTLLYSSTTKTIGFQLYEYWTFTSQPMSCAMAFGILLIVVALNFILNRLTKGEFSI